ncbi:uncharacterized protein M6B38_324210 [Iris pallida]|uniref:Uncharacterized protein n=1 Tax=Iris pallida TaxID=29817 RepID=A0AAX6H7N0_IRIPA|nr:uncharacterized protein M6B38_324210 [Iris pallida]
MKVMKYFISTFVENCLKSQISECTTSRRSVLRLTRGKGFLVIFVLAQTSHFSTLPPHLEISPRLDILFIRLQ